MKILLLGGVLIGMLSGCITVKDSSGRVVYQDNPLASKSSRTESEDRSTSSQASEEMYPSRQKDKRPTLAKDNSSPYSGKMVQIAQSRFPNEMGSFPAADESNDAEIGFYRRMNELINSCKTIECKEYLSYKRLKCANLYFKAPSELRNDRFLKPSGTKSVALGNKHMKIQSVSGGKPSEKQVARAEESMSEARMDRLNGCVGVSEKFLKVSTPLSPLATEYYGHCGDGVSWGEDADGCQLQVMQAFSSIKNRSTGEVDVALCGVTGKTSEGLQKKRKQDRLNELLAFRNSLTPGKSATFTYWHVGDLRGTPYSNSGYVVQKERVKSANANNIITTGIGDYCLEGVSTVESFNVRSAPSGTGSTDIHVTPGRTSHICTKTRQRRWEHKFEKACIYPTYDIPKTSDPYMCAKNPPRFRFDDSPKPDNNGCTGAVKELGEGIDASITLWKEFVK